MSGDLFLDWAALAVSLFNALLMLWLGLMVLLNAERRTLGVWVVGSGLLLGSLFFVSHSAILGQNVYAPTSGMNFWWRLGWVPVVALPFSWYVVMLWYSGFWDNRQTALYRRQLPWLVFTILWTLGLVALFIFSNPLPSLFQVAQFDWSTSPALGGLPVIMLAYPPYIVLCIGLSIDVLLRPGPFTRMMGDLARRRARPWLLATALVFLFVSLLVAAAMVWIVLSAGQRAQGNFDWQVIIIVALFDGVVASLIAMAVVLLGQAIVAYEVFTGKTLPRRGLLRQWRNAILLTAGYGALVSGSLTLQVRPLYGLLLTAGMMTAFYALFGWRSYVDRDRHVRGLRPFVSSQKLYEHLLTRPEGEAAKDFLPDVASPFKALCADVLGARRAYLVGVGALAPLVDPPLAYPADAPLPKFSLTELVAGFTSPQTMYMPLEPATYGGVTWAVPLWSERGLIGVLLLGEKWDGGLYTQEEIEIARASGERLIDTRASAEVAQRLMVLQRQRLAESQVLDRHARRVLHDDILPRLHTALLALSPDPAAAETVASLTDAHRQISALLREMPAAVAPEVARLGLFGALRRAVDDEWSGAFDSVQWQIDAEAERQAQAVPPLAAEVLFYAARESIRNAARHGRADAATPLHLRLVARWQDGLQLLIEDDGRGWRGEGGGGGQGLALHSTLLAVVGGTLAVDSAPGVYTRITLTLPRSAW